MRKGIPVAIITGGTRGIGKAIAKKLSLQGMSCISIGSSLSSINAIDINDHLHFTSPEQRHRSMAIDLTDWPNWTTQTRNSKKLTFPGYEYTDDLQRRFHENIPLFEEIWDKNASNTNYYVNLLVNCAGITQDSLSLRTSTDEISQIMNINFLSCVSLSNFVCKKMIRSQNLFKRGEMALDHELPKPPPPCIINISSILGEGTIQVPGTSIYSASKAALIQYTRTLSQETETWGIRALSMAPGLVTDTDMIQEMDPQTRQQLNLLMGLNCTTSDVVADDIWE